MDTLKRPRLRCTRPGITVPVRLGEGGLTRGVARGPGYRRTSRGYYVPIGVDGTLPDQRVAEAAVVLPAYGGVTGWAGLAWSGGHWFTGADAQGTLDDVWLATGPSDIRPQPGIRVSAERLDPRDLTVIDGLPMTSPVRSALFEMRYAAGLAGAVVVLGMAAYSDLVSVAEMRDYVERHPGWTGIGQARSAVEIADENLWSPAEARMLVVWVHEAQLPRPLCNVPVFDARGRHLGTPDMVDPTSGLLLNYDSTLHLTSVGRLKDRDRDERYQAHGLEMLIVVTGDLGDSALLARRMHAARQRALARARRGGARWTLRQPDWWTDTSTVQRRRELSAYQQSRLLRYRD